MEQRTVIHGSFMGGYGLPGGLVSITILGGTAAFLSRVWARPGSLVLWLILMVVVVGTIVAAELIYRRNVVEAGADRVRWTFRQPPESGDQPLSKMQRVEVFPSGARLVFEGGAFFASRELFLGRDIGRLVDGLRRLGVQVNEPPGAR